MNLLPYGVTQILLAQQELRITGDDRQEVVEIMSHPARELTNGLHLLALVELLLQPPTLDSHGNRSGHGPQCVQHVFGENPFGKHCHNTDEALAHDQGMACEGDHPFPPGPFGIANTGIVENIVREMRPPLLRDQPNLEFADRYSAVWTVEVRIHARTGL